MLRNKTCVGAGVQGFGCLEYLLLQMLMPFQQQGYSDSNGKGTCVLTQLPCFDAILVEILLFC